MVRNLLVKMMMTVLMLLTAFVNSFFFWKLIFWGHFLAGKNELVDFYFAFSQWILVIEKSVFFFLPSIDHSKCVIYNILTWKWKLAKMNKGDSWSWDSKISSIRCDEMKYVLHKIGENKGCSGIAHGASSRWGIWCHFSNCALFRHHHTYGAENQKKRFLL